MIVNKVDLGILQQHEQLSVYHFHKSGKRRQAVLWREAEVRAAVARRLFLGGELGGQSSGFPSVLRDEGGIDSIHTLGIREATKVKARANHIPAASSHPPQREATASFLSLPCLHSLSSVPVTTTKKTSPAQEREGVLRGNPGPCCSAR